MFNFSKQKEREKLSLLKSKSDSTTEAGTWIDDDMYDSEIILEQRRHMSMQVGITVNITKNFMKT